MSDLYERIVSQRGTFERILGWIPGFKGYLDKGYRRDADRMIRDYVAGELTKCVARLVELERRILDLDGGLLMMSDTNSVKTKLQTFRDRVQTAAPGYSGFMESIKIGPEELERIYAFDEAQIRFAHAINEGLAALDSAITAGSGIKEAIQQLDRLTVEANAAFSLRDQVITQIDKALAAGQPVDYSMFERNDNATPSN
ncbi:MAG: hypothetical protein NZM00_11920 [Anaerolinea sp.]|nr:hypothetical protein [Anaerolinea sp.]